MLRLRSCQCSQFLLYLRAHVARVNAVSLCRYLHVWVAHINAVSCCCTRMFRLLMSMQSLAIVPACSGCVYACSQLLLYPHVQVAHVIALTCYCTRVFRLHVCMQSVAVVPACSGCHVIAGKGRQSDRHGRPYSRGQDRGAPHTEQPERQDGRSSHTDRRHSHQSGDRCTFLAASLCIWRFALLTKEAVPIYVSLLPGPSAACSPGFTVSKAVTRQFLCQTCSP